MWTQWYKLKGILPYKGSWHELRTVWIVFSVRTFGKSGASLRHGEGMRKIIEVKYRNCTEGEIYCIIAKLAWLYERACWSIQNSRVKKMIVLQMGMI